jgi:LysM repeat protein
MTQENTTKTTNNDTGKKTMVISLALILLAAGLVGVVALYFINDNNLQAQITEQNTQIASMNSTISHLQGELVLASGDSAQISSLQSQIASLTESVSEYQQILNLEVVESDFKTFTQSANSSTLLWDRYYSDYGGYITLEVEATANSTYVNAAYIFANNFLYNTTVTVGQSGVVGIPIMTATYVSITLGNVGETSDNSGNVTLTYRY